MDSSGIVVWQLIIRKAYDEVAPEFWRWMSAQCDDYIIGQHDADEEIKTTHCHVMIQNPKVTDKAYDKQRKKYGLGGGASRLLQKVAKKHIDYDADKLGPYVTKGNITYVMSYSYPEDTVRAWCENWVDTRAVVSAASGDAQSDRTHWNIIQDIWKKMQDVEGIWEEYLEFNISGVAKTLNEKGKWVAYDMLLEALHVNKVRTSRNELERFYVTLVRSDPRLRRELGRSIITSVFR